MKYLVLLVLLIVAACAPMMGTTEPEATSTVIVLPDGTTCNFAGFGATLAFEDRRLNYTCGGERGLIGDVTVQGIDVTLELATLTGTTLESSDIQNLTITEIILEDGMRCLNAGRGATMAFEGRRLHYSCDDGTALIGEIVESLSIFAAERATLDGSALVSSEPVSIRELRTAAE
jgi:hypothetical protein